MMLHACFVAISDVIDSSVLLLECDYYSSSGTHLNRLVTVYMPTKKKTFTRVHVFLDDPVTI